MTKMLVLVLLASCVTASSPNYMVAYAPAHGHIPQTKAAAVQRAVVAITNGGLSIETQDVTSGIVLSTWFGLSGNGQGAFHYRLRVTITEAGDYTIDGQCEERTSYTGWSACDNDKRPRALVEAIASVAEHMNRPTQSSAEAARARIDVDVAPAIGIATVDNAAVHEESAVKVLRYDMGLWCEKSGACFGDNQKRRCETEGNAECTFVKNAACVVYKTVTSGERTSVCVTKYGACVDLRSDLAKIAEVTDLGDCFVVRPE